MRSAALSLVAVAMALAALPAQSQDHPKRKPGLWEIKALSGSGPQPMVMQQCTDDAFEAQMLKEGLEQSKTMCSKNEMRREGGKILSDSVCKVGSSTVIEARWLGPCLPGQKPGAMVMPGMPKPKSK